MRTKPWNNNIEYLQLAEKVPMENIQNMKRCNLVILKVKLFFVLGVESVCNGKPLLLY